VEVVDLTTHTALAQEVLEAEALEEAKVHQVKQRRDTDLEAEEVAEALLLKMLQEALDQVEELLLEHLLLIQLQLHLHQIQQEQLLLEKSMQYLIQQELLQLLNNYG
jgi:hypothetical protein